jgi:hypothetical protein
MLLVIIAGLLMAYVMEQRRRQIAEERARASVEEARAQAARAAAAAALHFEEQFGKSPDADKGSRDRPVGEPPGDDDPRGSGGRR